MITIIGKKIRLISILCAVVSSILLFSACKTAENTDNQQGDTVYTTFYAMYDFTKEIAGDKVNVVQLVPSGSGPHDFEPTAADIAKITQAKALIYCGSVDTYIEDIRTTAEKAGVRTLDTAEGITIQEDVHDPHIWLDPNTAMEQYTAIAKLLSELNPENEAYYQERLASAQDRINQLQQQFQALKASAKVQDIIVSHAAYGYLCKELGIQEHSIESGAGEGTDPTAKQMAEIINLAKEKNIKIIFAEKNESDKTARAVAKEIGGDVLLLDPFEANTDSGGYFEVMQQNIQALGTALK